MAHRRSTRLDGRAPPVAGTITAQWRSISRKTLSGRRNSTADRLIIAATTFSADGNAAAISIADIWYKCRTRLYNKSVIFSLNTLRI